MAKLTPWAVVTEAINELIRENFEKITASPSMQTRILLSAKETAYREVIEAVTKLAKKDLI